MTFSGEESQAEVVFGAYPWTATLHCNACKNVTEEVRE